MTLRKIVATGAAGFIGGMLYRDETALRKFGISAAQPGEIVDFREYTEIEQDFVSRTMKFGFPGVENVIPRKSFVLSYDRKNRVPHWVFEHLTKEHITPSENVRRKGCEVFEDDRIHVFFRSTDDDYKDSGFDRGHLAASMNHRCKQEYVDDTYVLSNMTPQVGKGFNQDAWRKLENHVIRLVNKYNSVYVCSGPLYLPRMEPDGKKYVKYQVIGLHDVAVPTHFFKIVLCERRDSAFDMEAYVMPNIPIDDKVPLKAFLVPKDVIERAAGLLLFEKLPNSKLHSINGRTVDSKDQ